MREKTNEEGEKMSRKRRKKGGEGKKKRTEHDA